MTGPGRGVIAAPPPDTPKQLNSDCDGNNMTSTCATRTAPNAYTPIPGVRQFLFRPDSVDLEVKADELWTPAYRASGFEVQVTPTAMVRAPGRRVTRSSLGGHPKVRCGGLEWFLDELVARAYLPRRRSGWELAHVDHDWSNCHANNLVWFVDPDAYEDELRRLMLPSPPCRCPAGRWCGCRPYYRLGHVLEPGDQHGRAKVQTLCRRGHHLTPDNTTTWGYGNRVCLSCYPRLR